MSSDDTPRTDSPVQRGKTADESPRSSRSYPPVTPGVGIGGYSAYHENQSQPVPVGATPHQDHGGSGNSKNADSYFDDNAKPRSESPTQVAAGARSGEELLRRLSLTHTSPMKDNKDLDPRASHPNLNLSGRIISATFVVPFKLKVVPGDEWASSCSFQFENHR